MLFGNVLERLKAGDQPPAPDAIPASSKPEILLEDSSLNQSSSFAYAAALISAGLVSPEVLEKLRKIRPNPTAMRIIIAIDMRNVSLARDLALDRDFILENEHFLASGQAVKSSLEKGFLDFARDLISAGYSVPKHLLIEAAREENPALIQHTIEAGLYASEDLELDLWYLLHQGYLGEARDLLLHETHLQTTVSGAVIQDAADARRLASDPILVRKALYGALRRGYDNLASTLLGLSVGALTKDMVPMALETCCVEFLRKVWMGDTQLREGSDKRRKRQSPLWQQVLAEAESEEERKVLDKMLSVANIIEHALQQEKVDVVDRVLSWPDAVNEPGVLRVLIKYGQQQTAKDVLRRSNRGATRREMKLAFTKQQYDLCVAMLRYQDAVVAFSDPSLQEILISLVEVGETVLQAVEIINRIPRKQWHLELTKDLCDNLNIFAKKRSEIAICYAPLLLCALTAELMDRLSTISLQHQTRCLNTKSIFIGLGVSIEDCIKDEDELKYLLTQVDSQARSVLTILSKNQYFSLLENDEIGTIVTKMWIGSKRHYGILGASTLNRSFFSPSGSEDAMQFTKPLDKTRPYMFHFEQWTESCRLRFLGQTVSTLAHVIIYQLLIYTAISKDAFMDVAKDPTALVYLRASQVWVGCIMAENLLHYLYGWFTGRGFHVDRWEMMEYFMFADMILLMLGLHEKYMGPGNTISEIDPKIFNATLHVIMMLFIWLRFTAVIVTDKTFGPYIRMIYLLITRTFTFFLIFFMLGLCFAAVITSIFYHDSEQFADFSTSIKTQISASLGNLDIFGFNQYAGLGAILLGFWTILSNVIMLNFIVALLTNIYKDLTDRVESEHAAIVIRYYDRWYWNDDYGLLIFLPPPLSYIDLALAPFVLFTKNKKWWSVNICKVLYVIYALPQFLYFFIWTVVLVLLMYCKGFVIYAKTGRYKAKKKSQQILNLTHQANSLQGDHPAEEASAHDKKKDKIKTNFSFTKLFAWTVIGFPWLIWAALRDCWNFWVIMYKPAVNITDENERYKMQQIVTSKFICDVQIVLEALAVKEISVQQFVETWSMVDSANLDKAGGERSDMSSGAKKLLAVEYFSQFANSRGDLTIDVERMRKLLPKRLGNVYSEHYLTRVQHVFLPWLLKGIKRYQQKIGSSLIRAQKHSGQAGGTANVDQEHLNNLQQSTAELECRFKEMEEALKVVSSQIGDQDQFVQSLGLRLR